jgi:hypothetical protein
MLLPDFLLDSLSGFHFFVVPFCSKQLESHENS